MSHLPRGMRSTRENLRGMWLKSITLISPFLLAILAIAIITLVLGLEGREVSGTGVGDIQWVGILVSIVPYAAIAFGYALMQFLYRPVRARRSFEWYTGKSVADLRDPETMKFEDALDAVAIAAGMGRPRLVFLVDDKRANAMAFLDGTGTPTVGVTTGLLELDVPVDEATAIMAHEAAHLKLGLNVRPPGILHPEFVPNLLLMVYLLLPVSFLFIKTEPGAMVMLVVIYIALFAGLLALRVSARYNMRIADLLYFHADKLADAYAVKLVRDPEALMQAVGRLHDANLDQGYDFEQVYLAKYLFLPYGTTIGDYYRFAGSVLAYRLGSDAFYAEKMSMLDGVVEGEKRFFRERMAGLDFITQGTVRSISDWDRSD